MGDLKNYHKMIKELMSDKVPNLPNYENFMKATNKSTVFILAFINFLTEMNRNRIDVDSYVPNGNAPNLME